MSKITLETAVATVNRGDSGGQHEARIHVIDPRRSRDGHVVEEPIMLYCSAAGESTDPWGFPVKVEISHEEAIILIADLSRRLAMVADSRYLPVIPKAEKISGGYDMPLE